MTYQSKNAEILALFTATGKDLPTEGSNMGHAVQILTTICDSQSHTVPDVESCISEMEFSLSQMGWSFFNGNATCDPYAENKNAGLRIDAKDAFDLQVKVLRQVNPKHEVFAEIESDCSEIFEALEAIESHMGEADFTLEFDGNEYRLINDSSIWEIYRDEIQDIVEDCYSDVLKVDDIPSFIAFSIDWEQTAQNAYADGYGHTFSR